MSNLFLNFITNIIKHDEFIRTSSHIKWFTPRILTNTWTISNLDYYGCITPHSKYEKLNDARIDKLHSKPLISFIIQVNMQSNPDIIIYCILQKSLPFPSSCIINTWSLQENWWIVWENFSSYWKKKLVSSNIIPESV